VARVIRLPAVFAVAIIRIYQATLGRLLGGRCRFHPTCSEYAAGSIEANGLVIGGFAAAWRVLRCGPWTDGGIEPVKVRHHLDREVVRG